MISITADAERQPPNCNGNGNGGESMGMTATPIVCPPWCTDCDRSKDRPELPPAERAITHSSRNIEGLTRDTSFWSHGLTGGYWRLKVARTDYYDGRVDGPNIWLNGYVHTPAEARMLGRALLHIADLAEI